MPAQCVLDDVASVCGLWQVDLHGGFAMITACPKRKGSGPAISTPEFLLLCCIFKWVWGHDTRTRTTFKRQQQPQMARAVACPLYAQTDACTGSKEHRPICRCTAQFNTLAGLLYGSYAFILLHSRESRASLYSGIWKYEDRCWAPYPKPANLKQLASEALATPIFEP